MGVCKSEKTERCKNEVNRQVVHISLREFRGTCQHRLNSSTSCFVKTGNGCSILHHISVSWLLWKLRKKVNG